MSCSASTSTQPGGLPPRRGWPCIGTGNETCPRFSLLKEAAALVEARGGTTATCQVNDIHRMPCEKKAEVKLADSEGDTVWACPAHAEERLVTVPGAFITSQDGQGIAGFLSRRSG